MSMGRKAIGSVVATALCAGAVYLKGDVPPGFAEMIKYILGVFIGGNLGTKAIYSISDAIKAVKTSVPPNIMTYEHAVELSKYIGDVKSELVEVRATQATVLETLTAVGQAVNNKL